MLPPSSLPHRAFAALAALRPGAEARPRTPKPPEAFVALTVTAVVERNPGEVTWTFAAAVQHPGAGVKDAFADEIAVPASATAKQARETILRQVREGTAFAFGLSGIIVPPDRIEVILL